MQLGHGEAPHKPRAKLRKAATGGGGRRPRGEQPPKAAGLPLPPKEGGLSIVLFLIHGWGLLRAAGRVRPVKPTAAGAHRAITIQRAAPTTLPRIGISAPTPHRGALGAEMPMRPKFFTHARGAWCVRCFYSIKISKSRFRIQLLPLRRQAFYSTSPPPKGWGTVNSIRSRPYVKGAAGGPHGPPLTTPAEGAGGKPTDTTAAAVWRVCAASCARLYDIRPRRK